MKLVVPATLAVIFLLLYLLFRKAGDALLVMAAVPFSLVGGLADLAAQPRSRWRRRSKPSRWPAWPPSSVW